MTKITWIDPPSGWKFGFPKQLPDNITNINEWLVQNGYPQSMVDQFPEGVPCGMQTQTIEDKTKPPKAQDYILSKISGLNLASTFISNNMPKAKSILIEFAKLHVEAALKEASKQASKQAKATSKPKYVEDEWGMNRRLTSETIIDTESILKSYPLTNII